MTYAAQLAALISPDRALFFSPPRSRWGRFWYRHEDRALRMLMECSPVANDNLPDLWVPEALLWTWRSIVPCYMGLADLPQTPADTLKMMAGDCEDGAILLASILKAGLRPSDCAALRFVVGDAKGRCHHAYLSWKTPRGLAILDWTLSGDPLAPISFTVDSDSEV